MGRGNVNTNKMQPQGLLKVSREEAKKETFFGYALVAED